MTTTAPSAPTGDVQMTDRHLTASLLRHRKLLRRRCGQAVTVANRRLAVWKQQQEPNEEWTAEQEKAQFAARLVQAAQKVRKQQQQQQQQGQPAGQAQRKTSLRRPKSSSQQHMSTDSPPQQQQQQQQQQQRHGQHPKTTKFAAARHGGRCPVHDQARDAADRIRSRLPPTIPPVSLPNRRQTAWDGVLQEMVWLATDFRHERVWKACAAHSVAHSIVQLRQQEQEAAAQQEKDDNAIVPMDTTDTNEPTAPTPQQLHYPEPDDQEVRKVASDMARRMNQVWEKLQQGKEKRRPDDDDDNSKPPPLPDSWSWPLALSNASMADQWKRGTAALLRPVSWPPPPVELQTVSVLVTAASRLRAWQQWLQEQDEQTQVMRGVHEWEHSMDSDSGTTVILLSYAEVDAWAGLEPERRDAVDMVTIDVQSHGMELWGNSPWKVSLQGNDASFSCCLDQVNWWKTVTQTFGSCTRRVVVENPTTVLEARPKAVTKESMEVLAWRALFLVGPATDARGLLRWVRKAMPPTEQKKRIVSAVRDHLCTLMDRMLVVPTPTASAKNTTNASWKVRPCAMTDKQRTAYEQCCRQVQSVLSRDWHTCGNRVAIVADVLFQLRQQCAHANLAAEAPRLALPFAVTTSTTEMVSRVLDQSGKFKELASILLSECVIDCALGEDDHYLRSLLQAPPKQSMDSDGKSKMIILAALPSLLLMSSCLLHHLGIRHQLLQPCDATKSRLEHEHILAQFHDNEHAGGSQVDVIVGSVDYVATLGVDAVDLVVLLDEDWSGCSEALLESIVRRCSRKGRRCRFVRLVTAESCEHVLVDAPKLAADNPLDNLVVDTTGSFCMDDLETRGRRMADPHACTFRFPADNLVRLRGMRLSEFLVVHDLPPSLTTSVESQFLPGALSEKDRLEVEFSVLLRQKENKLFSQQWKQVPMDFFSGDGVGQVVSHYMKQVSVDSSPNNESLPPYSTLARNNALGDGGTICTDEDIHEGGELGAAKSLLFYPNMGRPSNEVDRSWCTPNAFASAFAAFGSVAHQHDGNNGSETLLFTPPLLPRVQESAQLARKNVEMSTNRLMAAARGSKKRHNDEPLESTAKRAKLDVGATEISSSQAKPDASNGPQVAAVSRPPSEVSAIIPIDDFGLAGSGAVPLPRDSALSLAYQSVNVSVDTNISDWLSSAPAHEFSEEQDSSTDNRSVVLFVSRKRQRGYGSNHGRIRGWVGPTVQSGVNAAHVQRINGLANDTTKKVTKKKSGAFPESAFTRVSNLDVANGGRPGESQSTGAQSKVRDIYKKSVLASMRQSGIGNTLFESTGFRAAAQRVKTHVEGRLICYPWTSMSTFDVGPGLPVHISKPRGHPAHHTNMPFDVDKKLWTSIVKRLDDSASNDHPSDSVAQKQSASFRRSFVMPCRVDFGPFQCGFLSTASGMTASAPPRLSVGVSLPMGVKVSSLRADQYSPQWTEACDSVLAETLSKWGLNWNLAAGRVRRFQEFRYTTARIESTLGASRFCRDRWQAIARQGKYIDAVRIVEVTRKRSFVSGLEGSDVHDDDNEPKRLSAKFAYSKESVDESSMTDCDEPSSHCFLFATKKPEREGEGDDSTADKNSHVSRGIAAVAQARRKVKRNTVPLPRVPDAGQNPAPTPTHQSHVKAVQDIPVTGTRNAMWPLQILASRKQREPSSSHSPVSPSRRAGGIVKRSFPDGSSSSPARTAAHPFAPPSPSHNNGTTGGGNNTTKSNGNRGASG